MRWSSIAPTRPVPPTVDLNELAKSVLAKAVPLSLPREVDIAFEPAPSAPVIAGDAVSLREALTNLIDNALVHGARSRLVVAVGEERDVGLDRGPRRRPRALILRRRRSSSPLSRRAKALPVPGSACRLPLRPRGPMAARSPSLAATG